MRNTSTAHLLLGWDYRQFNTGALMIYSPEGQSIMRVFREAGRYSPDELDIPQLYTPTPDGFEHRLRAWVSLPNRHTIYKGKKCEFQSERIRGCREYYCREYRRQPARGRNDVGGLVAAALVLATKHRDREAIPVSLRGASCPAKK